MSNRKYFLAYFSGQSSFIWSVHFHSIVVPSIGFRIAFLFAALSRFTCCTNIFLCAFVLYHKRPYNVWTAGQVILHTHCLIAFSSAATHLQCVCVPASKLRRKQRCSHMAAKRMKKKKCIALAHIYRFLRYEKSDRVSSS